MRRRGSMPKPEAKPVSKGPECATCGEAARYSGKLAHTFLAERELYCETHAIEVDAKGMFAMGSVVRLP